MWYQLPETKPTPAEKPRAIFPWEKEPDRPQATRVFAEDLVSSPQPGAVPPPPAGSAQQFTTVHFGGDEDTSSEEVQAAGLTSPERPSSPQTADQQWQAFQQNNSNAWDAVPGIDTYVRAIMESQTKRGKPQILQPAGFSEDLMSPVISRKDRRESLILTDFPSAIERPSLPVTPAPIRRPTFWGEERDQAGELPPAEGVPDQQDWVCPKCGFISVRAEDFRRDHRESSIASTTTAVASPPPALLQNPSAIKPRENPSSPIFSAAAPLAGSLEVQYRAGVSPRGAPLASLSDPSLHPPPPALEAPTHFPGLSAAPSFASDIQPAPASTK
jgi:glycogenin glucosyltransferase